MAACAATAAPPEKAPPTRRPTSSAPSSDASIDTAKGDATRWFVDKEIVGEPIAAAIVDVAVIDGQVVSGGSTSFASFGETVGDEVDIVDCGGWVGTGRLARTVDRGWRVVMTPVAKGIAATTPCRADHRGGAFAIAPAARSRRRRPREYVGDPAATMARLPAAVQAWNAAGPPEQVSHHVPWLWSDLDDDGTIDLISVPGRCDDEPDSSTCEAIMFFDGAEWRVVGELTPIGWEPP
jgi:hypothetical protein